ncbi:hypothetical protein IEI91_30530, partial [Streptomyces sp. DEF1AK]|nr:hypothetical protein [Streptomyces sp. DEF1AK]
MTQAPAAAPGAAAPGAAAPAPAPPAPAEVNFWWWRLPDGDNGVRRAAEDH